MQIFLECLPCLLKQTLEAARVATDSESDQQKIMTGAIALLGQRANFRYAPELFRAAWQIIRAQTGVADPYQALKQENIQEALGILPHLRAFVAGQADRLHWALKTAATGNIIDKAVYADIDITGILDQELVRDFRICDLEPFRKALADARTLMIIGDNAGETVFDRILIENLPQLAVTYVVRSAPALNDATLADAVASGLDECATIISSGCPAPGLILDQSTPEFQQLFQRADLVISKGQGNFETLSDVKRPVFFLLKAKCPAVAKAFRVEQNAYIFRYKAKGEYSL